MGRQTTLERDDIIALLKRADEGEELQALANEAGVCLTTVYRWRGVYAEFIDTPTRRMRELQSENEVLREIVIEKSLEVEALKRGKG